MAAVFWCRDDCVPGMTPAFWCHETGALVPGVTSPTAMLDRMAFVVLCGHVRQDAGAGLLRIRFY